MKDITQALMNLRPGAQFHLKGEKLTWVDTEQSKPTEDEIRTEMDRLEKEWNDNKYQRDRAVEYPSIEDQLDKIFHKGLTEWKKTIQAVKDKHPKPTE